MQSAIYCKVLDRDEVFVACEGFQVSAFFEWLELNCFPPIVRARIKLLAVPKYDALKYSRLWNTILFAVSVWKNFSEIVLFIV